MPVGFVIDRGVRTGTERGAGLRASAFTVRTHGALVLPIAASIAIATSTTRQNCRSKLR